MNQTSGTKPRIEWLDIAKGGSIVCVAVFHSTLYMKANGFDPKLAAALNELLTPIRMPMFFTISGILGAGVLKREWRSLFARQIWTFAYLFALWSLIRWFYFRNVQDNVIVKTEGDTLSELATMWIMPESGLWFIWALAIFFVIGRLFANARLLAIGISLTLAAMTWAGVIQPGNFVHRNVLVYLPFFLCGLYFGKPIVSRLAERPVVIGIAAAIAFVLLKLGLMPLLGGGLDYAAAAILLSVSGLMLGCTVAIGLGQLWPRYNPIAYIGRNTLPIYVTHVLLISALSAFLARSLPHNAGFAHAGVLFLIAISLSVPLMLRAGADKMQAWWIYQAPKMAVQPQARRVGS
ncbi:acyltransferase family protein [Aliirhizobium smilacinae]|uniref:Acyltransferase 3 domain-containing protein n=1 Tax=Aliirhizobium smilacinae TaxID=1395944 RepID=A0A5C4XST8_9HYPH|nr:acyltransferase family protein [Rhizobium smilacinae]TNM65754.1 hypothetical protein FHP24_05790 [Rhizobium smilacinae]